VFSEKKRVEKIRYMHRNPVVRGLVLEPEEWAWSSFRHYAYQERGTVMVNEMERSELRVRKIS
jgi:putative transposase